MSTIVVLGAGIGGVSQAFELNPLLGKGDRLIVVNDQSHFEFTPSNPWVAVGWRTEKQITVELAPLFEKHGIEFIASAASRLQPEKNGILLANGETVQYDYLVIATGPKLAFDEVEGLGPDGYTGSICKTGHALETHQDFNALVNDPGPVIVGAAQGASCFGPAYEYAFILDTELRKRKIRDQVPMTFVTPEPYIGHLGLDGVGDTKGLLESELRDRHIHWITNAKIDRIDKGSMSVTEFDDDGGQKRQSDLEFRHAMILPAFKGIDAIGDIEGLVNPRGFVLTDEYQRNPKYSNIYSVGVCIAIPPVGSTPVPVGVPKTGFMIESMVTATAHNIRSAMDGKEPTQRATWNAVCLADFGDSGVAFVASPQIPPRNTNFAAKGKWVHFAKIAFEKYFLRKVRQGRNEPFYEKQVMKWIGADKLKQTG
mgnify:CR=1 FL=1|tara:strand:+ start:4159 stop:5436 length:1278 start_codon:yes stop_codon:yes gene_type:complete